MQGTGNSHRGATELTVVAHVAAQVNVVAEDRPCGGPAADVHALYGLSEASAATSATVGAAQLMARKWCRAAILGCGRGRWLRRPRQFLGRGVQATTSKAARKGEAWARNATAFCCSEG